MNLIMAIDHCDPDQVEAFSKVWRLSDAERQAIQARAAASRQFDGIARQDGVQAAVRFAMGRAFKGAAA